MIINIINKGNWSIVKHYPKAIVQNVKKENRWLITYECRWQVLRSTGRWSRRWGQCHRPVWNLFDSSPSKLSRGCRTVAVSSNCCWFPYHHGRSQWTLVPLHLGTPGGSMSRSECTPFRQKPALAPSYISAASLMSNVVIDSITSCHVTLGNEWIRSESR